MRRIAVLVIAALFALHTAPAFAAAPKAAAKGKAAAQATGGINGTAQSSTGQTLSNYTVQLRNVATGQLSGSTTSSASGLFSFGGLNPGSYVLEIVNSSGAIVGTSSAIGVVAGGVVSVTVTASAAAALGALAGGAAAAAGAGGAAGISTALIITTVAIGAGVTGLVVATNQDEASPSR